MFTLGFTLHKFRYYPYTQVQQLVSRIVSRDEKAALQSLSEQYSRDRVRVGLERKIDTGLLPLRIPAFASATISPFRKSGEHLQVLGMSFWCSTD